MAQYTVLSSLTSESFKLSDGSDTFRVQARNNELFFDQAITDLGFGSGGVEGTDWSAVEGVKLDVSPGEELRVGVRDRYWVIDQTYDPLVLGFSGAENFDWANVEKHILPDVAFRADSSIRVDTSLTVDRGRL